MLVIIHFFTSTVYAPGLVLEWYHSTNPHLIAHHPKNITSHHLTNHRPTNFSARTDSSPECQSLHLSTYHYNRLNNHPRNGNLSYSVQVRNWGPQKTPSADGPPAGQLTEDELDPSTIYFYICAEYAESMASSAARRAWRAASARN